MKQLIKNNRHYVLDSQRVFMAKKEGQFIEFGYSLLTDEEKQNPADVSNVGWKVHLSIDDSNKVNLAMGFDLIKDIVIDEQLTCKVVMPIADFYLDIERNGRQITIYDCGNVNKDWENILNRMENSLIENGINFTHTPPGDRPIQGSLIISYRNDDDGTGNYISAKDANYNYNYCGAEDPLDNLDLSPPNVRFHSR